MNNIPPKLLQERVSQNKHGHWYNSYECFCGTSFIAMPYQVKKYKNRSCGCLRGAHISSFNTTHGLSKHRLHGIWSGMIKRCSNPKCERYPRYGGKGITVCKEWLEDFKVFYDWAMSNGYAEPLTIERRDNDGNYEPSNCKWATVLEQQNNTSKNVFIIWMDIRYTMSQWAKLLGIPITTFRRWFFIKGYEMEDIIEKSKQAA